MKTIFTYLKNLNNKEKEAVVNWYKNIKDADLSAFNTITQFRSACSYDLIVHDGKNIVLFNEDLIESIVNENCLEITLEDIKNINEDNIIDIKFEDIVGYKLNTDDTKNDFVKDIVSTIVSSFKLDNQEQKDTLHNIFCNIFDNSLDFSHHKEFIKQIFESKKCDKEPSSCDSCDKEEVGSTKQEDINLNSLLSFLTSKFASSEKSEPLRTNAMDTMTPEEAKEFEKSALDKRKEEIEKLKKDGSLFFINLGNNFSNKGKQIKENIVDSSLFGLINKLLNEKQSKNQIIIKNDLELARLVELGYISFEEARTIYQKGFPYKMDI